MAGGNIPANLKPLFIAAGKQYHIPPRVLAGIASVESNLGANATTSSAGAVGLMQFLPSTARSIGVNPYNARSAIFGAAKLLNQYGFQQNPTRAIGAYNGGPGNPQYSYASQVMSEAARLQSELQGVQPAGGAPGGGSGGSSVTMPKIPGLPAIPPGLTFNSKGYQRAEARALIGNLQKTSASLFNATNPGSIPAPSMPQLPDPSQYLQMAQNHLQQLAGSKPLTVHPGAVQGFKGQYVNPLAGFSLGRTDEGVDASAKPGTPIRALGDSRLVQVIPDWYAGQPLLLFKILTGPKAGQYWYVAEQINPATTQIGHVFHAGQPVATFASSGTGIEAGWGSPTSRQRTLAGATTGYSEGDVTPAGTNFRNFIAGL